MIVYNTGYLNKEGLIKLMDSRIPFGIYETNRNTQVLVINPHHRTPFAPFTLYTHDESRKHYKIVEDKRILDCIKLIFTNLCNIEDLDTTKWNNGNQIITYKFPEYLLDYWFK